MPASDKEHGKKEPPPGGGFLSIKVPWKEPASNS